MTESGSPLLPNSPPSEPPSPASPPSSAPDSAKKTSQRRRGRPVGSKNKPKQPLLLARKPEPTNKTVQFELPIGCNIVEILENFARMNQVGIHVLDGSGSVRNLTLQNTSSIPSGILNLVTLSGTFMDPTMMAASSSTATGALLSFQTSGPWLRVIATGSATEVCGGIAMSRVEAASNVVVHAMTFTISEPKLLDPAEYATMPEGEGPYGGGETGGGFGSGLTGGNGSGGDVDSDGMESAPPEFPVPSGNMRSSNQF